MKLRNIFTALAAAALALVGCQKESKFLDEVQVDKSIVAIPVEGGQDKITVTATADWTIEMPEDAWFTVDQVSGAAGKTLVTFTAEATTETREVNVNLVCAGAKQAIKVLQMAEKVELPFTSCADVLAANSVGTIYKVKGTITDLTNYDKYGCFYVNDGTAQVYVYGSMNPTAFKPEVGDIISFEGPWTSYGNFDDVTILGLEKSLIKLEKVISTPLPLEGGVATVLLTVKDGDFSVEIPEDATWLTAGEPTNIGGATCVELTAAANEGGVRKTTVTFKTTVNGKDYIAMADIEQEGAIAEVSVADFLAKEKGDALYKLTGKVSGLKTGNYGNFHLVDATGSVYVYGLTATPVEKNDQSFPSLGIREGDIVTLIGKRDRYDNAKVPEEKEQVGGPAYYVSHIGSTDVTVAEFLTKAVNAETRYRLTGKITNLKTGNYGNFHLEDATGSVYVYGLTAAPVAKNDQSFPTLGLKEGDIVTLVGTRAQYAGAKVENEKEQVGGPAYYISHEAATEPEPETPTPTASKYVKVTAEQADWSGKYLIVFGSNAHASLASGSKDLNSTVAVTIVNDEIEATDALAPAVMTVVKNGSAYNMTFANGKFFGMQHNGCLLMDTAFSLGFAYTANGVKISGVPSGKTADYFLYANTNNGSYYRCYVDKTGSAGYSLPTLYKLAQ